MDRRNDRVANGLRHIDGRATETDVAAAQRLHVSVSTIRRARSELGVKAHGVGRPRAQKEVKESYVVTATRSDVRAIDRFAMQLGVSRSAVFLLVRDPRVVALALRLSRGDHDLAALGQLEAERCGLK